MSAYNWIIISARCPACGEQAELRCQTHVASDHNGDYTGRFHDREYRLGDKMHWWPKESRNYSSWRFEGKIKAEKAGEDASECCYTACPICHADLYAIIDFHGPSPVAAKKIGLETDWPIDYLK